MAVLIEEQHPIPQQISSYQFRLVGDMTLKQFFQVAAGAIISLILYSSGLSPAVKWPLIIISFLTGIAFAFFPLQDRPLSKWITLFIQAIYAPTIFLWKKNYTKPNYFALEPSEGISNVPLPSPAPSPIDIPQQAEEIVAGPDAEETAKLEESEKEFLDKVSQQFRTKTPPLATTSQTVFSSNNNISKPVERPSQIGEDVKVPQIENVAVPASQKTDIPAVSVFDSNTPSSFPSPVSSSPLSQTAVNAQFSAEASPPEPPETPNIIVGQTMSESGKILESTILEIRDSEGRPVRALKSNRLGHFMIVTPLTNGNYQITAEKEGYDFNPVNINLNGTLVAPIIIKGKQV